MQQPNRSDTTQWQHFAKGGVRDDDRARNSEITRKGKNPQTVNYRQTSVTNKPNSSALVTMYEGTPMPGPSSSQHSRASSARVSDGRRNAPSGNKAPKPTTVEGILIELEGLDFNASPSGPPETDSERVPFDPSQGSLLD
jgi:hypothetical protein